jgi:hypothetical protein
LPDTWIRFAPGLDARAAGRVLEPERLLALGAGSHRMAAPELGQGELLVRVWKRASLAERLSARFTRPRSASLAEREWNLVCYARANGVGTCEPLAVGAEKAPLFAESSFFVAAPPRNVIGLAAWMKARLPGDVRARGAQSLLAALERASNAGLHLELGREEELVLSAEQALGAVGEQHGGDCSPLGQLPARTGAALERRALPSVYVLDFEGARIGGLGTNERRSRELRRRLERLLCSTIEA